MGKSMRLLDNNKVLSILSDEDIDWKLVRNNRLFTFNKGDISIRLWSTPKSICIDFHSPEDYGYGIIDKSNEEESINAFELFDKIKQKITQQ